MLFVNIKKLNENAVVPKYETLGAVGMDLTATSKHHDDIGNVVYGTGLAIEIPDGYYADLRPRSSISKYDLILANSVGTIDSDYRGELMLKFKKIKKTKTESREVSVGMGFYDLEDVEIDITKTYDIGDRIAQIVILPYPKINFVEVENLSNTLRGNGSFGSSGV